jgi:putative transposase
MAADGVRLIVHRYSTSKKPRKSAGPAEAATPAPGEPTVTERAMKKKKHSHTEIAAKLRQADEMLSKGKLQTEVARALGVSVMTFHRWRKAANKDAVLAMTAGDSVQPSSLDKNELARRMDELTIENARLRRLVTDLILEKMKLEESIQITTKRRR